MNTLKESAVSKPESLDPDNPICRFLPGQVDLNFEELSKLAVTDVKLILGEPTSIINTIESDASKSAPCFDSIERSRIILQREPAKLILDERYQTLQKQVIVNDGLRSLLSIIPKVRKEGTILGVQTSDSKNVSSLLDLQYYLRTGETITISDSEELKPGEDDTSKQIRQFYTVLKQYER